MFELVYGNFMGKKEGKSVLYDTFALTFCQFVSF